MTGIIGDGAPTKKDEPKPTYGKAFQRLIKAGKAFTIAEKIATEKMPLMNQLRRMNSYSGNGMGIYTFSDLPISENHRLILAVGDPKTGFFQVPILQLVTGIDAMVTGTIDAEGNASKYETAKKLSEWTQEKRKVSIDKAQRVFGVALVPNYASIGDQIFVGGTGADGKGVSGSQYAYMMGVNGLMVQRAILGDSRELAPLMFPGENNTERFLRISDVLTQGELKRLGSEGVYPGLTFLAGGYRQEEAKLFLAFSPELSGSSGRGRETMSMGFESASRSPEPSKKSGGSGVVGLEVGDKSDIQYDSVNGHVTGIDGVVAISFYAVNDKSTPKAVRAELEKMV